MLTIRLRPLFIAVFGGAAAAAAVLATLVAQPGRAQAANAPALASDLARVTSWLRDGARIVQH
jgi:hypothetical protein